MKITPEEIAEGIITGDDKNPYIQIARRTLALVIFRYGQQCVEEAKAKNFPETKWEVLNKDIEKSFKKSLNDNR